MTESQAERLKQFNQIIFQEKQFNEYSFGNPDVFALVDQNSSNNDTDEYMTESPFRSSDPTIINRHKVIGFQKTGQLLRRIKRELSTKALQNASDKNSLKINDRLSTQHSNCNLNENYLSTLHWQKCEKDEMTEAMIDEYQKQILRLRAQLQDVKEEKKQLKQTLQKQRKFYMSEMYSKQLVTQEHQFQIEKLKGNIQKHINLQYQFQEKIRLLELENSQFKYQLEGWRSSSRQNSQSMEPIQQQNQDFCNNSTNISRNKQSNKMFMSLDNGFVKTSCLRDSDPFEILRLAHERQIIKYQKELKNLKQFYEHKIKSLKKPNTPLKGKPRNSISILDEYVCQDNVSCESNSYYRPQNLRHLIKDQYNFTAKGSSKKRVDHDCQSYFTTKYFNYPNNNSKKSLNNQNEDHDIFIPDSLQNQDKINYAPLIQSVYEDQQQDQKQIKGFKRFIESSSFIKGLTIGGIASGILAFIVCKNLIGRN